METPTPQKIAIILSQINSEKLFTKGQILKALSDRFNEFGKSLAEQASKDILEAYKKGNHQEAQDFLILSQISGKIFQSVAAVTFATIATLEDDDAKGQIVTE